LDAIDVSASLKALQRIESARLNHKVNKIFAPIKIYNIVITITTAAFYRSLER
jgi:hypothetical protein